MKRLPAHAGLLLTAVLALSGCDDGSYATADATTSVGTVAAVGPVAPATTR